jgi:hypothetical protein
MRILDKKYFSFILFVLFSLGCLPGLAMGQSAGVSRGIDTMGFRAEEPGEAILGRRYIQKEAFYAICPPALWNKSTLSKAEKNLSYAVRFKDPHSGDYLTLGIIQGGPKELTLAGLRRFRGDYLGGVRRAGLGQIVGSDLFRFKHLHCFQVIARKNKTVLLQLLIFDQPGSFLQLAYSVGEDHYHDLARTMEASIASLEWPCLKPD